MVQHSGPLKLSLPWAAADSYMSLAVPQVTGQAAQVFGGVGIAMGGAHALKALYHLCRLGGRASENDEKGTEVQYNRLVGEVATAAGMVACGAGAGVLAAPVVMAGAVITNLARGGAPEDRDTQARWSSLASETVLGAADTYLGWALGQPSAAGAGVWDGLSPGLAMQGLGWFAVGAHGLKAVVHGARALYLVSDNPSAEQRKEAWDHLSRLVGDAVKVGGLTAANCGVGWLAVPLIAIGSGISLVTQAGSKKLT
ncbi:MAG: hypothetical protein HY319_15915 [Armatimonadetes bacterium]|nr:hypothetical protein [Armatimonadota bacterium]